METRKIVIKEGLDTLRWGLRIKVMFTIEEAYQIKPGHNRNLETKNGKAYGKQKYGRRYPSLPRS